MTNDFKISSTGLSERSDIIDPPILPLLFLFHSIREITNKTLNSKPGTKNLFKQNTKLRGFSILDWSRVSFLVKFLVWNQLGRISVNKVKNKPR